MSEAELSLDQKIEMRTAHLAMIQGVIGRMSGYCAGLKNFCVTVVAGIFAFYSQRPDDRVLLFAFVVVGAFALLDARYLCLERSFRSLYDSVRLAPLTEATDFYIGLKHRADHSAHAAIFSWSVLWFYLPFGVSMIVLYLVFKLTK